jgi:hypothetical protein
VIERNESLDFLEPVQCFNGPNDFYQPSFLFAPFFHLVFQNIGAQYPAPVRIGDAPLN